jgi:Na+-transporting methylmalonyl-CoA/oxaloacetate decarboxylase gamma subunit
LFFIILTFFLFLFIVLVVVQARREVIKKAIEDLKKAAEDLQKAAEVQNQNKILIHCIINQKITAQSIKQKEQNKTTQTHYNIHTQ